MFPAATIRHTPPQDLQNYIYSHHIDQSFDDDSRVQSIICLEQLISLEKIAAQIFTDVADCFKKTQTKMDSVQEHLNTFKQWSSQIILQNKQTPPQYCLKNNFHYLRIPKLVSQNDEANNFFVYYRFDECDPKITFSSFEDTFDDTVAADLEISDAKFYENQLTEELQREYDNIANVRKAPKPKPPKEEDIDTQQILLSIKPPQFRLYEAPVEGNLTNWRNAAKYTPRQKMDQRQDHIPKLEKITQTEGVTAYDRIAEALVKQGQVPAKILPAFPPRHYSPPPKNDFWRRGMILPRSMIEKSPQFVLDRVRKRNRRSTLKISRSFETNISTATFLEPMNLPHAPEPVIKKIPRRTATFLPTHTPHFDAPPPPPPPPPPPTSLSSGGPQAVERIPLQKSRSVTCVPGQHEMLDEVKQLRGNLRQIETSVQINRSETFLDLIKNHRFSLKKVEKEIEAPPPPPAAKEESVTDQSLFASLQVKLARVREAVQCTDSSSDDDDDSSESSW